MDSTTIDKQNNLTPFKMESSEGVMDMEELNTLSKEQAEKGLGFCKDGFRYEDDATGEIKTIKRADHAGHGYKFTMKERDIKEHYLEECYKRYPMMCKEILKILVEDYIKNPEAVEKMAKEDTNFMKDIQED